MVLADDKTGRVVVPPMKISDVPYSQPGAERDFRSYKLQFQAPPSTGLFTWKLYLVSDTYVGEELTRDISVRDFLCISSVGGLMVFLFVVKD